MAFVHLSLVFRQPNVIKSAAPNLTGQNANFDEKPDWGTVKLSICKSGVLLLAYFGEPGIWSRFHNDKNIFFDTVGKVNEVTMSDYNPEDLALLTLDNIVRYIISFSYITSINPRNYGLRFKMILQNHTDTEHGRVSLKLWDSKSKAITHLLDHVVKYGSSEDLLWALVKIDDIRKIIAQNQMIFVVLKEEKKHTTSIWLSEINDLKFTKMSSLIMGVDLDNENTVSDTVKIDHNIKLSDKLPGLIFVSQITRRDGKKLKLTTVSYNYGNTFLPLKYKPYQGHCEWTSIEFDFIADMNDGEIVLASNKTLFLDRGQNWTELTLNHSNYQTKHFEEGKGLTRFKFFALISSNNNAGFDMVIKQKCDLSDYQIITPGHELLNACFHGGEDLAYTKISSKICESVISDLPKIKPKPCICTPEDYRW
ncbi:hypothetical protein RF11_01797 [Thelohanellus kitauei]|uniref:Uncharacterized protein n=1 Tax=Thelohanellus kitauei TaxID=669202 RepID=A0A0C2NCZ4_THEKT|nr:hypothetical protein RF11_01797 [Thelohanellus kitauei]